MREIPQNAPFIRVEIKNKEPLELDDLANSLKSLAEEYRRWLEESAEFTTSAGVKLYVKEVRTGSLVTDLVALAPAMALSFAENMNTVAGFARYLRDIFTWIRGADDDLAGLSVSTPTLQNVTRILEPVAKDSAGQINIGTMNVEAGAEVTFALTTEQSNATQNIAKRHIEDRREPERRVFEKVVLHWFQARNAPSGGVGDRAIIESISPRPVKIVFPDEADKLRMLQDSSNPFTRAYVVDATVETVQGRPVAYRITGVHDAIELE